MREQEIAAMREAEATYWWHIGRRVVLCAILRRFLPTVCHPELDSGSPGNRFRVPTTLKLRRAGKSGMTMTKIVDVGCGAGANLAWLNQFGQVLGIDNNPEAVACSRSVGEALLGEAVRLPLADQTVGIVSALDVLEHLPDDDAALQEWRRVLKGDGHLLLSVPAYSWLFGPHDQELQHHRRYLLSALVRQLRRSGFRPVFASYFFMFIFPVFAVQRLLSQGLKRSAGYNPAPAWINWPLVWLSRLEARLIKWFSLPFGSSIVVLARKV